MFLLYADDYWLRADGSMGKQNDMTTITFDPVDMTSVGSVSFVAIFFGEPFDAMLTVATELTSTSQVLESHDILGQQPYGFWKSYCYNIQAVLPVKVTFTATRGSNMFNDIGLDDVYISNNTCTTGWFSFCVSLTILALQVIECLAAIILKVSLNDILFPK